MLTIYLIGTKMTAIICLLLTNMPFLTINDKQQQQKLIPPLTMFLRPVRLVLSFFEVYYPTPDNLKGYDVYIIWVLVIPKLWLFAWGTLRGSLSLHCTCTSLYIFVHWNVSLYIIRGMWDCVVEKCFAGCETFCYIQTVCCWLKFSHLERGWSNVFCSLFQL